MSASETVRLDVPEAREGTLLAGKYLLEETIGSGGMGVVMAARHLDLDERVAIKFLQPEAAHDSEAVSRFAREAWAASKIKSEYVARVSDVGRLESGMPYIVMEHLEGMDLAQLLRTRGPQPIELAVEFVLQACEAIAEAHALGIVHRDLKPSNLFCVRRSDGLLAIKVLDFGISKVTRPLGRPVDISITTTATTIGSPLYMAPEQMSSAKIADERVDIWALGVILQQLMTAFPPFYAETLPELAIKIATEPPTPLRSKRPDAPRALERVVLRCLEKDRMRRYPDVAELAAALIEFGPQRAVMHAERAERVLRTSGRYGGARAEATTSTPPVRPRTQSGGHSSRPAATRTLWMLAAAAVAVLVAGGLLWSQYRDSAASAIGSPALVRPAPLPVPDPDTAATETTRNAAEALPPVATPFTPPDTVREAIAPANNPNAAAPATRDGAAAAATKPERPRLQRPAATSSERPAPASSRQPIPAAPPASDVDDLGGRI